MTYTQHGEEYLVTKDGVAGDLHIPMNIITDAIIHTADDNYDANRIEAYIRDANGSVWIKPTPRQQLFHLPKKSL